MFLAKSDSLISAIPPESVPIVIVLVSIIGFTIIIERLIYFPNGNRFLKKTGVL